MSEYKYLVMQSNARNSVGFLTASLGGSHRCADIDTNVTHFSNEGHYYPNTHDNDYYWNTPEELLVGFSRWYLRVSEKTGYNMGNRLYHATNTYRFFKVVDDMDDYGQEMEAANLDLKSYEITEEEFISDIKNSWAFKAISEMFPQYGCLDRPEQERVQVNIVRSQEFHTWCWSSDYLSKDLEGLKVDTLHIPIGLHFDEAKKYLRDRLGCKYRFGGNDAYNKRKELEGE